MSAAAQQIMCPGCQTLVGRGARKCPKCGTGLVSSVCSRCGHENDLASPICGKCFADLRTKPCPECGAPNVPSASVCTSCREPFGRRRRRAALSPDYVTPAVVFLANIALFLTALVLAELVPDSRGTFATAAATLGAVCAPVALVSFIAAAMVVRGVRPIIVWLACLSGATIAAAASLPLYLVVFGVGLSVGFVLALPVVIGAAEELAKVCSLFWLIRRREYDTELHGLVFGAAAGLGFASVENVGYLVAAYRRGGIDLIAATMLARLLTSLVHAALSSSLAAVLWRERRVSVQVTNPVLFTYILVSILHAVWNYQVLPQTPTSAAVLMMVFSGICIAVLFLVRLRLACLPSRKTRT